MSTFTDPRDGNIYKTVEINGQTWLAENLRYKGVDFRYPNNDERKTKFYGLLYKWKDAMKACPEGWHLPTQEEFKGLLEVAGATSEKQSENLRALGWGGTNTLGFRALPAAGCYGDYSCYSFGHNADFWSATEYKGNINRAYILGLSNGYADVYDCYYKDYAFSVRCVKD